MGKVQAEQLTGRCLFRTIYHYSQALIRDGDDLNLCGRREGEERDLLLVQGKGGFVALDAPQQLISLQKINLSIPACRPHVTVSVNSHFCNIFSMADSEPRALATLSIDYKELSLIGACEEELLIDAAEGPQALSAADRLLMLDFPGLLSVMVQFAELPASSLFQGECLVTGLLMRQLHLSGLPLPLPSSPLPAPPLLPAPLLQVLLHGLVVQQVREGGPLALIVLEHLVEEGGDLAGALLQTEPVPDHLLAGEGEAVDVILKGVGTGIQPVVALLVELLQPGRAVGRRPRETPGTLIGPTAESEISQFELEVIIEDYDVPGLDVPVHDGLRLEVSSKFDKFNNKAQDVREVVVVGPVLYVLLKRSQAPLEQEADLVALLPAAAEGLVVIFEYLND